jgi:hypothetical protein
LPDLIRESSPKLPKLRPKERKILKYYYETGGDLLETAKLAKLTNTTVNSLKSTVCQTLKRLNGYLPQFMEEAGLDDAVILGRIKEGVMLPATHQNSPKFIDTTLKLKGYLKTDTNIQVNVLNNLADHELDAKIARLIESNNQCMLPAISVCSLEKEDDTQKQG